MKLRFWQYFFPVQKYNFGHCKKIDLFDFTSVFCQNTIPTIAGDASSNVDASSSKMQFDEGECKVCF